MDNLNYFYLRDNCSSHSNVTSTVPVSPPTSRVLQIQQMGALLAAQARDSSRALEESSSSSSRAEATVVKNPSYMSRNISSYQTSSRTIASTRSSNMISNPKMNSKDITSRASQIQQMGALLASSVGSSSNGSEDCSAAVGSKGMLSNT